MVSQMDDLANRDRTREIAAGIKSQRLKFNVIGVVAAGAPHALPGVFTLCGMPAIDSSGTATVL